MDELVTNAAMEYAVSLQLPVDVTSRVYFGFIEGVSWANKQKLYIIVFSVCYKYSNDVTITGVFNDKETAEKVMLAQFNQSLNNFKDKAPDFQEFRALEKCFIYNNSIFYCYNIIELER